MRLLRVGLFVIAVLLCGSGCRRHDVSVVHMPEPDYPFPARERGIQGTVVVNVGIGTDGRVQYASGNGATVILVDAAKQHAEQLVFEVPARASFPLEHEIKYTYVFDKDAAFNLKPRVETNLPDEIKVIAGPARGDRIELVPNTPEKHPPNKD